MTRLRPATPGRWILPAVLLCLSLLPLLAGLSCTRQAPLVQPEPPPEKPARPEQEPEPAPTLFQQWQLLLGEQETAPEEDRITAVNSFFNRFQFIEDRYLWGEEDYWATLGETLARGGGDCEDLTLAKYFTLMHLEVPEQRMRITYARSVKTGRPHMVLALFPPDGSGPLVLDTDNNLIFAAADRPDLVPVYSFNRKGYWLAEKEKNWQGRRIGAAERLSMWRRVLRRMNLDG